VDVKLLKLPKQRKKAGSRKDRQVMAHRAKHARYLKEGRRDNNKARRMATQKRREAKQASKHLAQISRQG
jgi:hypothetical protein